MIGLVVNKVFRIVKCLERMEWFDIHKGLIFTNIKHEKENCIQREEKVLDSRILHYLGVGKGLESLGHTSLEDLKFQYSSGTYYQKSSVYLGSEP